MSNASGPLGCKIEEEDCDVELPAKSLNTCLEGLAGELLDEVVGEVRLAVFGSGIEGEAEILGERALTRTVEPGKPDTALVATVSSLGIFEVSKELFVFASEVVGYNVFARFP